MLNKLLKYLGILGILLGLIFIYKNYNPLDNIFFPKCPFRMATGLECPGCGSQRAIHQILNFNLMNAAKENILVVVFLPYILLGIGAELWKDKKNPTYLVWRNRLFGIKAIYSILVIVIGFWILRNIIPFLTN